jgi:hypothetical protein
LGELTGENIEGEEMASAHPVDVDSASSEARQTKKKYAQRTLGRRSAPGSTVAVGLPRAGYSVPHGSDCSLQSLSIHWDGCLGRILVRLEFSTSVRTLMVSSF